MRAIQQAEGYLGLGMGIEAWNMLEDLPTEAKNGSRVLALRLAILIQQKSWQKAIFLAEGILKGLPKQPGVWLDLARAQAQLGKLEEAKISLCRSFELDQELRLIATCDDRLAALW